MYCDTARPSFIAGLNLIFRAAAIAFSVNPYGNPDTALIPVTCPLEENTARSTTVPETWFFRASSVYCGSGLDRMRAFCVTSRGLNVRL
jgi:hypothetical protein